MITKSYLVNKFVNAFKYFFCVKSRMIHE